MSPCPFCGSEAELFMAGDYYVIRCGGNDHCPMGCVATCAESVEAEAIAVWNKRFVCLDKNGDSVFAGDSIRGWIRPQCRDIEDPDHDDGVMSWDARGLIWRLKTGSFQKSIMHNYDYIELIKEKP